MTSEEREQAAQPELPISEPEHEAGSPDQVLSHDGAYLVHVGVGGQSRRYAGHVAGLGARMEARQGTGFEPEAQ